MSKTNDTIIYTHTDEAPALATQSLLPIVEAFTKAANIKVTTKDISLSGRILANFADKLPADQRQEDALTELGELAKTPNANIIKLPNISASIPQLTAAIKELQTQGSQYQITQRVQATQKKRITRLAMQKFWVARLTLFFAKVIQIGELRLPSSTQKIIRTPWGKWSKSSKSHVAHMSEGDFFSSEQSHTMTEAEDVRIELHSDGVEVLKDYFPLQKGKSSMLHS